MSFYVCITSSSEWLVGMLQTIMGIGHIKRKNYNTSGHYKKKNTYPFLACTDTNFPSWRLCTDTNFPRRRLWLPVIVSNLENWCQYIWGTRLLGINKSYFGGLAQLLCKCIIKRSSLSGVKYDDVIKWKHFPRYRSPVNSPHNDQWRGVLMFSLICA